MFYWVLKSRYLDVSTVPIDYYILGPLYDSSIRRLERRNDLASCWLMLMLRILSKSLNLTKGLFIKLSDSSIKEFSCSCIVVGSPESGWDKLLPFDYHLLKLFILFTLLILFILIFKRLLTFNLEFLYSILFWQSFYIYASLFNSNVLCPNINSEMEWLTNPYSYSFY